MTQALINSSVRRQILLEGVKRHEAERFLDFLKEMDADLRIKLSGDISTDNAARINAQINDIALSQRAIIDKYTSSLDESYQSIANTESNLEAKALNSAILSKGFEAAIPDAKQILAAVKSDPLSIRGKGQGLNLAEFTKAYTDDQVNLIRGRLSQGFAEGETTQQILQSLRGTKARNYADGILSTIDRNTQTMVRTALQNVSSVARQAVWNENSDVVVGVVWVSTLDDRTTSQCQALDGEQFPLDSGPRPPIHFGCRSTTAPVLADDLQYLEKGQQRPSKGQNSEGKQVAKQVSAKTNYYEWLKTQPESFQDHALGVTKAEYFRSGKLTVDEFRSLNLNKNFQPVSVAEFESKAKSLCIDKIN